MNILKSPTDIWSEYYKGRSYNAGIGLYDRVSLNENFYLGKQWEGLNAPELEKPVLNFLKRAVNYYISMLVSDDVSAVVEPFIEPDGGSIVTEIMSCEIDRVIERTKAKSLHRDMLRNAAVDGDGCFYLRFDPDISTGQTAKGEIVIENIDNTKILFGNPYVNDVQIQPYLLLIKREMLQSVKERARLNGCKDWDSIISDNTDMYGNEQYGSNEMCTVVTKLWRENGTVHSIEVTSTAVVKGEVDTGCKLYPIAYMNWERIKDCYHGQAPITGLIPNQISVNRLVALAIHNEKTTAFPKIFYDVGKIDKWTNKVGEAIAVNGNPNEAIASSFRAADMSNQVVMLANSLMQWTKDLMGASDAALGSVNPNNTSAIIAVQKASAMPLELQRLAFYQFVEDYVKIIVDMIGSYYGTRLVSYTDSEGNKNKTVFDFSNIDMDGMSIRVDVGNAAYWNELTQIQTLDNLFTRGIINDAILYLEQMPNNYIKNKNKIIANLKEQRESIRNSEDS